MEKAAFPTEWILRKKTHFFFVKSHCLCVQVGSAFTLDPAGSHKIYLFWLVELQKQTFTCSFVVLLSTKSPSSSLHFVGTYYGTEKWAWQMPHKFGVARAFWKEGECH